MKMTGASSVRGRWITMPACMQVYISFGKKRDHTVIDCMVKEDGVWKVESVASMNISDNLMME